MSVGIYDFPTTYDDYLGRQGLTHTDDVKSEYRRLRDENREALRVDRVPSLSTEIRKTMRHRLGVDDKLYLSVQRHDLECLLDALELAEDGRAAS